MSREIISHNATEVNQQFLATSYDSTDDYTTPLDAHDYTPIVTMGRLFKAHTRVNYMYDWDVNGNWVRVEPERPQQTINNNNELITDFLNCSQKFQSELKAWVNAYSMAVTFTRDAKIAELRNFLANLNGEWNYFINQWACRHNFTTYNNFSKQLRRAVDKCYDTIFEEHGLSVFNSLQEAECYY